MAELRHSSSLVTRSSSSPLRTGDDDSSRDRDRPIWWVPFLGGDDLRASPQKSKVSIFLILFLAAVASLISVYGLVNHLVKSLFLWIRKRCKLYYLFYLCCVFARMRPTCVRKMGLCSTVLM